MLYQTIEGAPASADETLQELHRKWTHLCELNHRLTFMASDLEMAVRKGEADASAQKLDLLKARMDHLQPKIDRLETLMLGKRAADVADLAVLFDLAIGRCDLTMPDVTDFEAGRGDAAVKFARELLRLAPAGTVLARTRSEFGDTWEAIAKAA